MMKKTIFVAMAMMTAICGCKAGEQTGGQTGDVVKETRKVGRFNGVQLIGPYDVVCTLGDAYVVTIEATKAVADKLLTEVKDGILTISSEKIAGVRVVSSGKRQNRATVYVTLPDLQKVALVGSGDITVKGKVAGNHNLDVALSGSGDVTLGDVDVNFANVTLAGSGDIEAGNVKGKQVNLRLSGSGDLGVKRAEGDKVGVTLAGSGNVRVGSVKAIAMTAQAAGSGDVEIDKVDCTNLNIVNTGSSDMTVSYVKAITATVNKTGSGDVKIAGSVDNYNEVKYGSGEVNSRGLKAGKITQTKHNGHRSTSVSTSVSTSGNTTTSPNGIEAEP